MSWVWGNWQDFMKKKACRYILQHYLGQFLKEKLSLDQLSLDLYNGTGRISELNLDVQAINEDLVNLNIPVELVDGFVDSISVNIPWSSLVTNSTKVEVKGLELTLRPSQRFDNGNTMFSSMTSSLSSMTTSLQLAKDCLESEKIQYPSDSQPIEGVQKFAQMIDSVLSKVRVKFVDTVVRLEHHPDGASTGVALEVRIRNIEYFDDLATTSDGTSVDGSAWEPAAISHKNLLIDGIQIFFDEIPTKISQFQPRSNTDNIRSQMFQSAKSSFTSSLDFEDTHSSITSQPRGSSATHSTDIEPVQIAMLTGMQEIKVKTKQSDSLHGPKLEISCQFGALHVLLSPSQLHGLLELVSNLTSPASCSRTSSSKNKPMNPEDFQRVEMDLQQQLQTNRVQGHRVQQDMASLQSGDDNDQYFSLMTTGQGGDMESSFSSNYSASSNRTTSTVPSSNTTGTTYPGRKSTRSQKESYPGRFHEDPSAELNQYQLRVAFFSVTLFHNNPGTRLDQRGRSAAEVMCEISKSFFRQVMMISIAGQVDLQEIRENFSKLLTVDHLRLLGKPLNIESSQKTAMKQQSVSLHLTIGILEAVESLYDSQTTDKQPDVSELLVFKKTSPAPDSKKNVMYSSISGGKPCLTVDLTSVSRTKVSHKMDLPRTDINMVLGEFYTELDLTIIDRINSLLTPQPLSNNISAGSIYRPSLYSMTQTLDEGPVSQDQRFHVTVTSSTVTVFLRFPIPDLRQVPHQSWWQRNLREEILIAELHEARFSTDFVTNQSLEEIEFTCAEIKGYFNFKPNEEPRLFAHVSLSDGSEEGFDRPRFAMKFCQTTRSVLEEEAFSDDTTPNDSLNGACQFVKPEPSPFSSRKSMYGKEHDSGKTEISEEMVLPADKEEFREFQEKSVMNTNLQVELSLPQVCLFLPDKLFYEVLYNRLNNDLLLWKPAAPAPVTSQDHFAASQHADLNVYNHLLAGDHYEMAKSAIKYDSDSESDTDAPYYSIHDTRSRRHKKPPRQQQSTMCLSLSIGKGQLTAFTESKRSVYTGRRVYPALVQEYMIIRDVHVPVHTVRHKSTVPIGFLGLPDASGVAQSGKHGEIFLRVDDVFLFTVANHNGDPNLQYLYVTANQAEIYHNANVEDSNSFPIIDCQELSAPIPAQLKKSIYRSDRAVLVTTRDNIGCGVDSLDMVSVAVKIRLDTKASNCDLTSDERVKEFTVSVGLRGATMRHRMSLPYQNVFTQLIDFLDVKDYQILGYTDPKVLTELHVHLWTCAIDYRPDHLPLLSVLTAESFSISSNIVAQSASTVLRFILDDGALFLSKKNAEKKKEKDRLRIDLKKDFVCVADVGRLELTLRSHEGKDQFPRTDLRVLTNRLNLRTCPDSLKALIDLIKYLAADGDLNQSESSPTTSQTSADPDISVQSEEETCLKEIHGHDPVLLSESSMDHVHTMMTEAMRESSSTSCSSSVSPDSSTTAQQTEVFFVPDTGQRSAGAPRAGMTPIVITQDVDSVTSSTVSGCFSENDEDEDDFCIIDDPAWEHAPRDGEPKIREFSETPVEIKDNYFSLPLGRTDLLKAPENFPLAESRYTLKELTLVWYMYGGFDFEDMEEEDETRVKTAFSSDSGVTMSYHHGSPDRWVGLTGGREAPLVPRDTLHTRGGPGRDHSKCMELQLTKVRFQHERYPDNTEEASRQVLLIHDVEVRDRLRSSKINKFLYQYSSEDMPRQTYANMVYIKALHRRPNLPSDEEECALKVSLQPIRLNIDQDTLFFLRGFFMELSGGESPDPYNTSTSESAPKSPLNKPGTQAPAPVMTVNKPPPTGDSQSPQDLLMQFDELTQELSVSLGGASSTSSSTSATESTTETETQPSVPVFFKSFVFSPDVPIRLDYHGKFDREHGTLAGFGGLVSLNRSELKLKSLICKQGILGSDRLFSYCLAEWLKDIKVNQLPNILGGFGPMHSIVQLAHGIKDLFWMPVEQYRKDGRIVRGIQRGAASFSTSTAMSVLELTNRVVQGVQWCAELTFDMVSPGPRRRCFYPKQPSDLREGVTNAYIVLREGFSDTANTLVDAATKEHEQKGVMGAVGGVLRQIPPTIVQPLIIVPEATSNLLGGMRSQLKPDTRKEDEEKWKEEIID